MARAVTIDERTGDGRHGEILDVLQELVWKYGSAANAAANMIRSTSEFENTLAELKARGGPPADSTDGS